ncbi:hypothetical protein D3C85_877630 [compost metagenome]
MNNRQKKQKAKRYIQRVAMKAIEKQQQLFAVERTKGDVAITYTYDLVIKHYVQPLVHEQFGYGPVRMQRFMAKVAEQEEDEGMPRGPAPIFLTHEWARSVRFPKEVVPMIYNYAFARARDVLKHMGYGETRLTRMFDVNVPDVPGWNEIYDKGRL